MAGLAINSRRRAVLKRRGPSAWRRGVGISVPRLSCWRSRHWRRPVVRDCGARRLACGSLSKLVRSGRAPWFPRSRRELSLKSQWPLRWYWDWHARPPRSPICCSSAFGSLLTWFGRSGRESIPAGPLRMGQGPHSRRYFLRVSSCWCLPSRPASSSAVRNESSRWPSPSPARSRPGSEPLWPERASGFPPGCWSWLWPMWRGSAGGTASACG